MGQLKGALYMLFATEKKSFAIFWGILIGILLLTVVLVTTIPNTEFRFSLTFPVYIYGAVAGALVVRGFIPYLIKLGATRRIISVALGIYGLVLSFVQAFISNVLTITSHTLFGDASTAVFSFTDGSTEVFATHLADFFPNPHLFNRLVIDVAIIFFLFVVAFLISLFFYRYGTVAGIVFIVLGFALIQYGAYQGWLERFFERITEQMSIFFFYELLLVGLILYIVTYLFMHRLTIKG